MDAGTLIWILLIAGGVLAMFFMHRGGHAHGGRGGRGGDDLGQGHDHSGASADEPREPRKEDARSLARSGSHDHGNEPVRAGGKHRGC